MNTRFFVVGHGLGKGCGDKTKTFIIFVVAKTVDMKRFGLLFCAAAASLSLHAAENTAPRWIRHSAISPDASSLVFEYQGDLFTVPAKGGRAVQLTTDSAHDTEPVWTADGKSVVFSSWRDGSKDIWIIPAEGGSAVKLTDFGGRETPLAVSADGTLYLSANIQEDFSSSVFPGDAKLYKLSIAKAAEAQAKGLPLPAPEQVFPFEVGNISVNAAGQILYEDVKGYEDALRKHHTSAIARDIWSCDGGSFTRLTTFPGEDRNPLWAPDGKSWYYLSEQGGTKGQWGGDSNVFSSDGKQLTHFEKNPVRYMSIAQDGTLAFSWNGDLYTLKAGEEPAKVEIKLQRETAQKEFVWKNLGNSITSMAVSPDGKELAFVLRGDVYTTTTELSDTRRITFTPEQEREVSFGEDGRSIYYDSERDGIWGVYRVTLDDKKDKHFTFCSGFTEERISPEGEICFQPAVSPDGKHVAYLKNRAEIIVAKADGKAPRGFLKGANASYSDGDLPFAWSPDSRSILTAYQGGGRMYNEDIALIDIETGTVTDLTESGYSDGSFRWAAGGKAMTWESDKEGYRSHGSWGAEGDIYVMFFDDEAFADFRKSEDVEKIEKFLKSAKEEKKEAKDSAKAEKKPVVLELSRREDRIVRLTGTSGRLGDHWLTPDGKKLYYTVRRESGTDLCCLDVRKGDVKTVSKDMSGSFYPSPDGSCFYVAGSRGITRVSADNGTCKGVDFKGEYKWYPAREREYIFEHCVTQVREKFYDKDMHGVDWEAVAANYRQFLPYIADNYAFQELLSEMLGELNGSHTGGRYYDGSGISTAHMGVVFDSSYSGKGLRIAEFLPGSPLLTACPSLKPGDIVMSIDSREIESGENWYQVLQRKSGKRVLLEIKASGKPVKVYVKTSGNDSQASYKRWVRNNEKLVRELSGGKIGYVHVQGMNSPSFREVYSKALGKYRDCDALIVDTRHNGGGWLHNDLANFLSGHLYTERRPRGAAMSPEPYDKWIKPSCVLVCEDNYSDACGFPYLYRALGLGKIIGSPVPGTATSVWWERQVDPTIVFGIPQIGSWSISEGRFLENHQLVPDIEVYNDPASVIAGRDLQLEAAVAEMLKTTRK